MKTSVLLMIVVSLCYGEDCLFCKEPCKVIPVVNGLPGPDLIEKAKKGEVILGGCGGNRDKAYRCEKCSALSYADGTGWSRPLDLDGYRGIVPKKYFYVHGIGEESYWVHVDSIGICSVTYSDWIDSVEHNTDIDIHEIVKMIWPNDPPKILQKTGAVIDPLEGALKNSGYVKCSDEKLTITLIAERRPRIKYITYTISGFSFDSLIKK